MSQREVFEKIGDNFTISWDPVELTKDWEIAEAEKYMIIKDPNGKPHWQRIGKILFGRNFDVAYPNEAREVLDGLKQLQARMRENPPPSSALVDAFLSHEFKMHKVNITKIESGVGENLHFDKSRAAVVNIGVINSETCLTHAWTMDGPMLQRVLINDNSVKYTYQHKDGEVYLLNTGVPHSVETLVKPEDGKDRYVLGYLLIDRDPTDLPVAQDNY